MADIPPVFLGLLKVLIPAVLMNVYVVGLNQLYDIEIDKKYTLGRPIVFTRSLISATAFMCFFSVVIALFKDIPDIEGDRKFGIQSFSVHIGQKRKFEQTTQSPSHDHLQMLQRTQLLTDSQDAQTHGE
ncbi:hypothetical protein QJS10_CPA02g01294 [Acorus calamus]|uniref:Uncharacterized protein n=1 Tax=Acorus calamus TaxID=4465 RepID=A0AAV9FE78_ACOCL|nr:hypothetical protein QJS10_CPA02g01294 [Acorus calamus]